MMARSLVALIILLCLREIYCGALFYGAAQWCSGFNTVASQQEESVFAPWFRPTRGCYVEFACSPRVRVVFTHHCPKDMHIAVRLTGDSKLTMGVNVSVNGCLSLYVGHAITLATSPNVSWDPRPLKDKGGWMELYAVHLFNPRG